MTGRREEVLAAELERVARELRAGQASLCGYRVRRSTRTEATRAHTDESGAIDYSGGWLTFHLRE